MKSDKYETTGKKWRCTGWLGITWLRKSKGFVKKIEEEEEEEEKEKTFPSTPSPLLPRLDVQLYVLPSYTQQINDQH